MKHNSSMYWKADDISHCGIRDAMASHKEGYCRLNRRFDGR